MSATLHRISRFSFPRHVPLGIGFALLAFVLVLFLADSSRLQYVSPHFAYTATLLSTDNDYDQVNKRYTGERYSRGNFSLQPIDTRGKTTELQAALDLSGIDGQHITNLKRNYTVYTRTGQHLPGPDEPASYLFAPRNLHKGQGFAYKHITYNAVAQMHYIGSEQIDGLEIFRYDADYGTARIEQDKAPGTLPSSLGLAYTPHLQVWVEPVTGWLIKYQEDTTIYAFNRTTQVDLGPISHFTTTFTTDSVNQHVHYAQDLRGQLAFGQQIVPGVLLFWLLLAAAVIVIRRFQVTSVPVVLASGAVLAISLVGMLGWLIGSTHLRNVFLDRAAINPLSLLCFAVLALCILFIHRGWRSRVVGVLAGLLIAVAGLQLLALMGVLHFSPDLLLLPETVKAASQTAPSRMSIITALLFLGAGIGMLKSVLAVTPATARFARVAAGLVLVIALCVLLAKMLLLDRFAKWTLLTAPSTLSSVLSVVCGAALLQALHHKYQDALDVVGKLRELAWAAVLTTPLLLIIGLAQLQQNALERQLQTAFAAQVASTQQDINHGIANYGKVLQGAQALFAASESVERSEWAAYIDAMQVNQTFAGSTGVGYVQMLQPGDLLRLQQQATKDGVGKLQLFPAGNRPSPSVVLYLVPFTGANRAALGYDMLTDAVRGEAMERARTSGQLSLSGAVSLLQDTNRASQSGFLLFLPVYRHNAPVGTADERQQALQGYVYGTLTATPFLQQQLGTRSSMAIKIYDGIRPDTANLLYSNQRLTDQATSSTLHPLTQTITIYPANRPWTIQFTALPSFQLSPIQQHTPALILVAGGTIYILTIMLLYSVREMRLQTVVVTRATDDRKTRKP